MSEIKFNINAFSLAFSTTSQDGERGNWRSFLFWQSKHEDLFHVCFGTSICIGAILNGWNCKLTPMQEFSTLWDIKATPTFFFLRNGQQIDKLVGANKQELQKKVNTILNSQSKPQTWQGLNCQLHIYTLWPEEAETLLWIEVASIFLGSNPDSLSRFHDWTMPLKLVNTTY